MTISIESLIEQTTGRLNSPVADELGSALKNILGQHQGSLEALTTALKDGELTQTEYQTELEREKELAIAELETLQIVAKAEVQKIVNQAFQALTSHLL